MREQWVCMELCLREDKEQFLGQHYSADSWGKAMGGVCCRLPDEDFYK